MYKSAVKECVYVFAVFFMVCVHTVYNGLWGKDLNGLYIFVCFVRLLVHFLPDKKKRYIFIVQDLEGRNGSVCDLFLVIALFKGLLADRQTGACCIPERRCVALLGILWCVQVLAESSYSRVERT